MIANEMTMDEMSIDETPVDEMSISEMPVDWITSDIFLLKIFQKWQLIIITAKMTIDEMTVNKMTRLLMK